MNRTEQRLIDLEGHTRVLHSRVIQLEDAAGMRTTAGREALVPRAMAAASVPVQPSRPSAPPPAAAPRPRPAAPTARPAQARMRPVQAPRVDMEDLLGGRVLAWLGGIAVVLGLAFFFALAISRGWIDETTRVALAAIGSFAILGVGVWLRENRGRNQAAMAAAATGLAGLFLTIVVAAQSYDLIAATPALVLALIVGAAGTALALRWNAQVIGAIGTLGAVLAPALAGAPSDATTVALLFVATAAGAAILVYKHWTWLALALFALATPQWALWTAMHASRVEVLVTLCAFGCAGLLAAIGFELRSGAERLRHSAAFLLTANTLVLALVGWLGFRHQSVDARVWIAGLALVHAVVGGSMRFERRISPDLSVLSFALGVVLADIAWASFIDGPGVAVGWALSAVGFAWTTSRRGTRPIERQAAAVGLGGQIAVALGHILVSDVPPTSLSNVPSIGAAMALAFLAAACLISGRFAEDDDNETVRTLVDTVGLAAIAYLTAATLDGAALVAAFAAEACVLGVVSRVRDDAVAGVGALVFLGIAALHMTIVEAPPNAFIYGAPDLPALLAAAGAVALATARLGIAPPAVALLRSRELKAGAAITVLWAASIAIVSAFQPGAGGIEPSTALDLGVRQEGQMLVSGLWSLTGAIALILGLTRDSRDLRRAGLALLALAIGKVFLFDLATLASVYRVISFVALGIVLLAGSYAWQRLRPEPLPDLREMS